MQFNVAQLLRDGVGSRRTFSMDESFQASEGGGTTRVLGGLALTRIDKGLWASGQLEANASGFCSRCLDSLELIVQFRLEEEYLPTVDVVTGIPIQVPEISDGVFTIDPHHILDITEAVRQYIFVNFPMKPLCLENCAGLCSTCGANLNKHQCQCTVSLDSRWTPLLGLLSSGERE